MKSIRLRKFSKYAAFLIVIQSVVWVVMLRFDSFIEISIFLYYPTVWMVERFGNFSGEANIIEPILIGVPIGIVVYSIILAAILTFLKRGPRELVVSEL